MNEGNEAPLPTGGLVPTAYVPDYGHWNSETSLTQTLTWLQDHLSQQADVDKSSQLDPNPDCANVNCVWYGPLSAPGSEERVPGHSNREDGVLSRVKLRGYQNAVWWKRVLLCSAVPVQSFKPGSVPEGAGPNQAVWCQMDQTHSPDLPSFRDEKVEVLQHYSLWLKCLKSK